MSGYIRQDTSNNIATGNVINAGDLDNEFDALVTAFNTTSGHKHDGTSGEGPPITATGPSQDVVTTATALHPKTDNTVDLGTSSLEFKNLYIDGVANIDSLVADTADINAGTIDNTVIGGTTAANGTFAALAATSGTVDGVNIATISASQTLTNKTISADDNTLSGIAASSFVLSNASGNIDGSAAQKAIPAGVVVGTTDTQTLTNKTINLTSNTLVTTSAQLAAALTDETGTGSVVFSASPTFTGTPLAPTATNGTNTTQIATTAFVQAALSGSGLGDMLKAVYDTNADGAVNLADAWTTGRTITIGSTGKSVNGSANVSWSLTEIGVNDATLTLATSGIATGSQTFTSNQSGPATFTVNVPGTDLTATGGTTAGPTIVSSTGADVVIPSASSVASGIVTTGTQTFAGQKTFSTSISTTTATLTSATITNLTLGATAITATGAQLNFVAGVTSAIQTQLDGKQPLDADLTALAGVGTTGILVRTGAGTVATRAIAAGTGITIADGTGVSANPTLSADLASQAEAEAGTDNTKLMTPLRVAQAARLQSATLVTISAGGVTNIDFTGIPSWAKRVTVMFGGLSTNGTSPVQIQIGDSGGIENTGYGSAAFSYNSGTAVSSTTGFVIDEGYTGGAQSRSGTYVISLLGSNAWAGSGVLSGGAVTPSAGGKSLTGGPLDRLRVTTMTGADTFDIGGVINIMWE